MIFDLLRSDDAANPLTTPQGCSHTYGHLWAANQPSVDVFGLWKETWVEKTHAGTGGACKQKPQGFKPSNAMLWGNGANNHNISINTYDWNCVLKHILL